MPSADGLVAAVHSHGARIVAIGQAVDLQTYQRALEDGKLTGVVDPRGASGQARMDAVPGHRASRAMTVGDLHRRGIGLAPGVGLGEAELRPSFVHRRGHRPVRTQ